jgi:hypothetical protein
MYCTYGLMTRVTVLKSWCRPTSSFFSSFNISFFLFLFFSHEFVIFLKKLSGYPIIIT